MLTQLAIQLLSKALADVVKEECFSPDLLQVGIWSGHIELVNLELKENIFDTLGLPIALRYARIGRMDIKVPWKFLGSSPVSVVVENVHVLAYAKYEWDAEAVARRQEARKRAQLIASYSREVPEPRNRTSSQEGKTAGYAASFAELMMDRLLNRILDGLQVEVRDVHLRFEDLVTSPSQPYTVGCTLESFTLGSMPHQAPGRLRMSAASPTAGGGMRGPGLSTSAGGRRSSLMPPAGSSEQVLKLAQVRSMSLYCNPITNEGLASMALHELERDGDVDVTLAELVPRGASPGHNSAEADRWREGRLGTNRFILHPADASCEFLLGKRDVAGGKTRVIMASLHIHELRLTLEDHLLRAAICLSAGLLRFRHMDDMGLERPTCSVAQDARAWWRYAYRVVLLKIREHKSKWDFDDMLRRREVRLLYLDLWARTRRQLAEEGEQEDEIGAVKEWEACTARLAELESQMPMEEILAYRRMGDAQLRKEGFLEQRDGGPLSRWRGLMGPQGGKEMESLLESEPAYVSFVLQLEVSLHGCTVALAAGKGHDDFMRLSLHGVGFRLGAEGTEGPKFASISLQNLTVLGRTPSPPPADWRSKGMSEQGAAEEDAWQPFLCRQGQATNGALFKLEVELCPSGSQYQALVRMDIDKTEVCLVPEAPWLTSVQEFLDLPDMADSWATLETLALAQVYQIQETMPAKLEYILQTHFRARLDVNIRAPLLRVLPPSNPDMSPRALRALPEIHVDLGNVTLMSLEHGTNKSPKPPSGPWVPTPPPYQLSQLAEPLDGSGDDMSSCEGKAEGPTEGDGPDGLSPTAGPATEGGDSLPSSTFSPVSVGRAYDDNLYDVYKLDVDDICVSVAPRDCPSSFSSSGALRAPIPLLDPCCLSATIYDSRLAADPGIMRFRLHLHVSDVHLRLSDALIRSLARLGPCYLHSKERAEREMQRLRQKVEDSMHRGSSMTRLQSFVRTPGSSASSGSLSLQQRDRGPRSSGSVADGLSSRRTSSAIFGHDRAPSVRTGGAMSPDCRSFGTAADDDYYSLAGFDDAASLGSIMSTRSAVPRRGGVGGPVPLTSPPNASGVGVVAEEGVDLASLLLQEPEEYDFDSAEEGDDDWDDEGAYAEADAAAPLSREASGRGGNASGLLSNGDGPHLSSNSVVRPQHLADVVGVARRSLTTGNGNNKGRRKVPLRRSISDAAMNRKLIDVALRLDSVCLSISHDPTKAGLGSPSRGARGHSSGGGGGEAGGSGEEEKERVGPTGRRRAETLTAELPLLVLTITGVGLSAYHTARCVKGTLAVEGVSLEALGDLAGHELRLLQVTPHEATLPTDAPSPLTIPSARRASALPGSLIATSPRRASLLTSPVGSTTPRRGSLLTSPIGASAGPTSPRRASLLTSPVGATMPRRGSVLTSPNGASSGGATSPRRGSMLSPPPSQAGTPNYRFAPQTLLPHHRTSAPQVIFPADADSATPAPAAVQASASVELDIEGGTLPFRELRSEVSLGVVALHVDQRPLFTVLQVLEPLVRMSSELSSSLGSSPPRPSKPPTPAPPPGAPPPSALPPRLPRVYLCFEMKSLRVSLVPESPHPRASLSLSSLTLRLHPTPLRPHMATLLGLSLADAHLAIEDSLTSHPVLERKAAPQQPHALILEAEINTALLLNLSPPPTPSLSPPPFPNEATDLEPPQPDDVAITMRMHQLRLCLPLHALLSFAVGMTQGPLFRQLAQQPPSSFSPSPSPSRPPTSPLRAFPRPSPDAAPPLRLSFSFVAVGCGVMLPLHLHPNHNHGQGTKTLSGHVFSREAGRGLGVELGKVDVGASSQGANQVLEARIHGSDWMLQQVCPDRSVTLLGLSALTLEGRQAGEDIHGAVKLATLSLCIDDSAFSLAHQLMDFADSLTMPVDDLLRDLAALSPPSPPSRPSLALSPPSSPSRPAQPRPSATAPLPFRRIAFSLQSEGSSLRMTVPPPSLDPPPTTTTTTTTRRPPPLSQGTDLVISMRGISVSASVDMGEEGDLSLGPQEAGADLGVRAISISLQHTDHARGQFCQVTKLLRKARPPPPTPSTDPSDTTEPQAQRAEATMEEDNRHVRVLARLCVGGSGSSECSACLGLHVQSSEWTLGVEAAKALGRLLEGLVAAASEAGASGAGKPATSIRPLTPPPGPQSQQRRKLSVDEVLLEHLSGVRGEAGRVAAQKALTRMLPFYLTQAQMEVHVSPQYFVLQEEEGAHQMGPLRLTSHRPLHALVMQAGVTMLADGSATYEVTSSGRRLVSGLGVHVDVNGADWRLTERRLLHAGNSGDDLDESGATTWEETVLVAPLAWSIRTDVSLPLAPNGHAAGGPARVHRLPIHVNAEMEGIEAWAFLDNRPLEHLTATTLLPIAEALTGAPDAGRTVPTQVSDSPVATADPYYVHKVPIATPDHLTLPNGLNESISTSVSPFPPSAPPAGGQVGWDDVTRLCISVTLRRVHLTVVDNCVTPSLPLLRLTLGPCHASVEGADGMVTGRATLQMRADVFNRRLVLWEPFLEPCAFRTELGMGEVPHASPSPLPNSRLLSLHVVAPDVLQVNVTESFLETLMQASVAQAQTIKQGAAKQAIARALAVQPPPTPSGRTGSTAPLPTEEPASTLNLYWIRNDTGVLVSYLMAGEGEEWATVPPGMQEVLCSPVSLEEDAGHNAQRPRTLTLSLQRAGQAPWGQLADVSYHDEQTILHSLSVSKSSTAPPLPVVTEVVRQGGAKVLRVRSPCVLSNSCPQPLHLAFRADNGVVQWEASLAQDEETPLPLHLSGETDAALVVRLGNGPAVDVAMPAPDPPMDAPDDECTFLDMTVRADRGKPGSVTFLCLRVRRGVDSQGQACSPELRTLTFLPPFVLANLLPVAATFEVGMSRRSYSPSKRGSDALFATPVSQVKLRPGETFPWYGAACDRHEVTLRVKLLTSHWSHEALLRPLKNKLMGPSDTLTLELQEEKSAALLKALVEVAWVGPQGACVLSLFVPFWLLNATSLNLAFGYERDTKDGLLSTHTKGASTALLLPSAADAAPSHARERPQGLLALLQAPPNETTRAELLVSRAMDHLLMAGYSSYSSKTRQPFTRLLLRHSDGAPWSPPITLLPGASEGLVTTLELQDRPKPNIFNATWQRATTGAHPPPSRALGLSVSMWSAGGVFHRTRLVAVSPRLLLVNAFGRGLEVRQDDAMATESCTTLLTAQRAPLYWANGAGARYLRVRIREFGWEWSGRVGADVVGDTTLRLRNTHNDVKCFMQVRVTLQEPSFLISFRREPVAFAPYVIENRTLETVWFGQTGVPGAHEVLLPYHTCAYAWDEPSADHVLELERQAAEGGGGGMMGGRREALGTTDFNPDTVRRVPVKGSHLMLDVVTRGAIRVLLITDSRLVSRPPPTVPTSAVAGGETAELAGETAEAPLTMHLDMSAAGVGISVINSVPQELVYTSILRLQLALTVTPRGSRLGLSVGHMQVDDQNLHTQSRIVVIGQQPPPPSPSLSASSLGTMEMGPLHPHTPHPRAHQLQLILEQEFGHDRIVFIRALHVGMVPFHVRLDGNLVASLLLMATNILNSSPPLDSESGTDLPPSTSTTVPPPSPRGAPAPRSLLRSNTLPSSSSSSLALSTWQQQQLRACLRSVVQHIVPPPTRAIEEDSSKVFIDHFSVDPIRLQVSFRASSMVSHVVTHFTSGSSEQHRILKAVLDVITSVVSKVDDAPLRFSRLTLQHLFLAELSSRTVDHYVSEVKWQAYVLLGTLAAFGNPVSALANVSTGVRDFVFEPAKALSEGNLWHFYQGLVRGSHSLVTRLLLSGVDSLRAVVSSGHAAILPLVLLIEEEEGRLSTRGSLQGMFVGLASLFTEPLRGLRVGGLAGLRNGLARGAISMGLRPMLGMLEDVMEVCQMMTHVLDPHLSRNSHISRIRPPRLFRGRSAPLEVYSAEASIVNDILSRLDRGAYWREGYFWFDVSEPSVHRVPTQAVVVTSRRILSVLILHRPRRYELLWQVPLSSLLHVDVDDGRPPSDSHAAREKEKEGVVSHRVVLHYFLPSLTVTPTRWLAHLPITSGDTGGGMRRRTGSVSYAEAPSSSKGSAWATPMGGWLRRSIADSHPGLRIGRREFVLAGRAKKRQKLDKRVKDLIRGLTARKHGLRVTCPWLPTEVARKETKTDVC